MVNLDKISREDPEGFEANTVRDAALFESTGK